MLHDCISSPDSRADFCLLTHVQLAIGGAVKHIFSSDFYFPLYENSIIEYFYLQIVFGQRICFRKLCKKYKTYFCLVLECCEMV